MFRYAFTLLASFVVILVIAFNLQAQVDANTLLLLKFENSLSGEQGEAPTTSTGHSYQAGIQGQGALLPNPNNLRYSSANNINATEGTVEFWMKPTWAGNDGQDHAILSWGGGGGIVISKDGGNYLKIILNRFGAFPGGEKGIAVYAGAWTANQWHHVAFTYSNTTQSITVYTDGIQRSQTTFSGVLPAISSSTFQIGGDGAGGYSQAVVDEMRISSVARTATEISQSYIAALTVSSITIEKTSLVLWKTWRMLQSIAGTTPQGVLNIPPTAINWTTSDPSVATVDSQGRVIAVAAGTATITGTISKAQATVSVTVREPVLPPRINILSDFLKTPAANSLYEIPVLSIRMLPTTNGIGLDPAYTMGAHLPLAQIEPKLEVNEVHEKFMLEEASRFRGYGNQIPRPSLGYRVVASITLYEPTPPGKVFRTVLGYPLYLPDYPLLFERLGLENYVNNLGVKEVWVWHQGIQPHLGGYDPNIHRPEFFRDDWESNMASPTTGDISNSDRDNNDLPIYDKTYVVHADAIPDVESATSTTIHGEGHQLESILAYVNQRQDGNVDLFSQKFIGRNSQGQWTRGRAGDTHHPPNADSDYDYLNTNPFLSDIADWRPAGGGQTVAVNVDTWGNAPYMWPGGSLPHTYVENQWHMYWRQSMPGYGNTIPYGANRMTNWWQFAGDWDAAYRSGVGLYEAASCTYSLSSTSLNFANIGGSGSVTVTAGAGCKWFASSNGMWAPLVSGDIGNGSGTVNFSVAANSVGGARSTKIIVAGQPVVISQDAATMTVSGRVTNAIGRGIKGATVSMTDALNMTTTVRTDAFGRYAFQDVRPNEVYTLSVANRRYGFTPQQVFVNDNLTNIDFVGALARPDSETKGEWMNGFW